jgi:hypothetical protein
MRGCASAGPPLTPPPCLSNLRLRAQSVKSVDAAASKTHEEPHLSLLRAHAWWRMHALNRRRARPSGARSPRFQAELAQLICPLKAS